MVLSNHFLFSMICVRERQSCSQCLHISTPRNVSHFFNVCWSLHYKPLFKLLGLMEWNFYIGNGMQLYRKAVTNGKEGERKGGTDRGRVYVFQMRISQALPGGPWIMFSYLCNIYPFHSRKSFPSGFNDMFHFPVAKPHIFSISIHIYSPGKQIHWNRVLPCMLGQTLGNEAEKNSRTN